MSVSATCYSTSMSKCWAHASKVGASYVLSATIGAKRVQWNKVCLIMYSLRRWILCTYFKVWNLHTTLPGIYWNKDKSYIDIVGEWSQTV